LQIKASVPIARNSSRAALNLFGIELKTTAYKNVFGKPKCEVLIYDKILGENINRNNGF
jgi:hypothetical protein